MKKTRLIALVMLAALILPLAACGEQKSDSSAPVTTTAAAAETTATDETTTEGELQPNLPDYDFGGKTFTFLVRGSTYNEWASQDIYAEAEDGEPVNDAVYTRNSYLEDKYNVVIAQFGASDCGGQSKKAITAGDSTYDVLMCNTSESASLAQNGYLIDLYSIPNLSLSSVWWDQRSVQQLSIDNILYFCTGDLSIMANDATWILMFNKDIWKSYNLDNIYDLVNSGKWTMDKMYDMMKAVAHDVNGDSVVSPLDDVVGFATHSSSIEGIFFASGSHIAAKDASDMPYLDCNNERITDVITMANKLMADPNITFNLSSNKFKMSNALTDLQPVFQNGHSLFYGEVMQCIIRLRAMEVDFGVISWPKYDEAQESYDHFIHTTACMVSVPMTNGDLNATGIMLEAMAAKSKYTLKKAYYETCLQGKFTRDEESASMLDLITSTRNYDLGYIYDWGGLFSSFSSCVSKGNTDFASAYAKKETKAQTAMQKTIDSLTAAKG